jgi:integrase/recombinase XerC
MEQTERAPDAKLVDRYLDHCRFEKRLADRTLTLYALDLAKLQLACQQAQVTMLEASAAQMRRWVADMRSKGRSSRGIALILSGWRGFYTWANRQGLITLNPVSDVRPPKREKPLPKALSVDQAQQLADHVPDERQNPWLMTRDKAMVELLYGCGLRVGELTSLDAQASPHAKGWCDLNQCMVFVTGKGGKSRAVPLGSKAAQAVRQWMNVRSQVRANALDGAEPLFMGRNGSRLTSQSIWQRLRLWSQQAGLPSAVHPHMLRHSFASHVLQSSADLRAVQELLGHAAITTTQVYTRLDFQHLSKAYDAAHPRAKRAGGARPPST